MTDDQIRMLLRLGTDEAKLLLDQGEHYLYRGIQDEMVGLARHYEVRLPLNCLQFLYFVNSYPAKL